MNSIIPIANINPKSYGLTVTTIMASPDMHHARSGDMFATTPDGATNLQAVIMLALIALIALPAAYVTIRDAARAIRSSRRIKGIKAKIKEFERSIR